MILWHAEGKLTGSIDRTEAVSQAIGVIILVLITVVLSMGIIVLLFSVAGPVEKPLFATFKISALNDTILEVYKTGGDHLSLSTVTVRVNSLEHNGSEVYDNNSNSFWDNGEFMLIGSLNLSVDVPVVVSAGTSVLLTTNFSHPASLYPTIVPTPAPPLPNTTLPTPPPPSPPAPCPTPAVPPASYADGLIATYYNNTNWTDPIATAVVPEIRFANLEASTTSPYPSTDELNWPVTEIARNASFSACFDGYLNIAAADTYTFYLRSDDGSFLQIDGLTLIDNGGYHEDLEKTGMIPLTAGHHRIKVFVFQAVNMSIVHLQYSSPAAVPTKQFVSAPVLCHAV